MATIDSHLVEHAIKQMVSTSNAVKSQVRAMFKQLEKDAFVYDELEVVDPSITDEFSGLVLRKVYLRSHRHNFRVIFAHWVDLTPDHVDLLLVFPRRKGYTIDWEWILESLRASRD